ncbi:CDI toxin immunity protein [Yersinia mollaretii]|uniref:CDI toxin immunity protein n=1 Tax=Yersinia mollaretii TaxID=33060 RepID=UPI00119F1A60|nr:hypothetical protein [Yersinia mollaretii]
MTLFEECKEALGHDFYILEGQDGKDAINILHGYPFVGGNISWSEIEYVDYDDINEILSSSLIKNNDVFVFADEMDIPVFGTKLIAIAKNIYDVTALSPKLFIFNDNFILQPLFPTEKLRLGVKG